MVGLVSSPAQDLRYPYSGACFNLRAGYEVPLHWGLFYPENRI